MSYEMKDILKTMIDNNEPHWSADTMDMVKQELMDVYEQTAEASELRKQNSILSGQLDTLKINLVYYKKKADKYEAKAEAFEDIYAHFNQLIHGEIEQREFESYAFDIAESYSLGKYESGESDE